MLGGHRIVLLVALGAGLLLAAPAAGREGPPPAAMYWLGPYFGGYELNQSEPGDSAFTYGDCEPPEGEGGCPVPVQVQNYTSCERNPIGLDRLPIKVFLVRGGGLAAAYEPGAVDVGTGAQTVTLYSDVEEMGAVLRDLYRRSESAPQPLQPPVYPLPVLRELVRVTVLANRLGVYEIARKTGLNSNEVKLRIRIAKLLGPKALAGVKPPTMSVETVERLRQLAFNARWDFAKTAREAGLTKAQLRKKLRLVRGLLNYC